MAAIGYFKKNKDVSETHALVVTAIVAAALLVGPVISHLRKGRSLQDKLAGTWLVPK